MANQGQKTICIIGVGLIGGSLALAFKRNIAGVKIIGCDYPHVLSKAEGAGVIDERKENPADAVRRADFVFVATPIRAVPGVLGKISRFLKPGAVVSDVGSVKSTIVRAAARELPENVTFIGGHPMAGAERGGVESADPLLFENAAYVLCPPHRRNDFDMAAELPDFVRLITSTGAHPIVLSAERHDRIAAAVSHLPQLVAVALTNLAVEANQTDGAVLRLAAGGFRDLTRIASSPFTIWSDIINANRFVISELTTEFGARLNALATLIDEGETDEIRTLFERAKSARETIPRNTKGFVRPLADIYVYAEDKPGFLHRLTGVLVDAGLNVKDIELLKIREGTGGAFRIGFSSDADAEKGMAAVKAAGFVSHRL